jgi:N4-gp56 family major capsid protein
MPATGTSALSAEVRPLYDADYLLASQSQIGLDQFTDLREVTGGERGQSVNFPILENLQPATGPLSELSDVSPVPMTASEVVVTLFEWGNAVQVTRFVKAVAYPDVYQQAAQAVGNNQAESIDFIIRPVFGQGARVVLPSGVANRAALTATNRLTGALMLRLSTLARGSKTPAFEDGFYGSVMHANMHYDLLQDSVLMNLGAYQKADLLFNGEIGFWQGIRFVVLSNWKAFWGQGAPPTNAAATTLAAAAAVGDGTTAATSLKVAAVTNINPGDWLVIQDAAEPGNVWSDTNELVQVITVGTAGAGGTGLIVTAYDPGPNNAGGLRYAHASGTTVKTAWNATGSANVYPLVIFGPQSVTKAASSETGPYGVATVTGPFDVLGRFVNHGWYLISGWQRTTERWLWRLETGGTY